MKPIIRFAFLLILLGAGLIYFGCQKKSESLVNLLPGQVTATISGRVTDNNNEPVEGAVVKAGSSTGNTDINGEFRIKDAALDKSAGFIKVEKNGFFLGTRTITINAGGVNYVSIQLIKKVSAGSFNSGSGGTVTVSNGGNINFQSSGIILADSKVPYSGNVAVDAFFISPAAANFKEIMPGALRGITSNNEATGLQSFGMMAVELTGASGQKLQLAPGKSATITFPIPAGLLAQAPATIPLWYLDETTGLWKEEGSATRTGNNYVGSVAHFSFWNCDAPFYTIDFTATVKDQNNKPIANTQVVIKSVGDDISLSGYGTTDSFGVVGGKIPGNKSLQLLIYNRCGTLIHSQNIGPFATNTDLGTISVNNPAPAILTISGTAINCAGGTLANGFVNIFVAGTNYRANIEKGTFSITINRCDNTSATAQIVAVDLSNNQQGSVKNVNVTSGAVNAGQLSACGTSTSEYINYTVNGVNYGLLAPNDSLIAFRSVSNTMVSGSTRTQNSSQYIDINFSPNVATGITPVLSLYLNVANQSYSKNGNMNVNVTEYGAPGEYIAGSLTGNVRTDSTANAVTVPITCNFRVKRAQ